MLLLCSTLPDEQTGHSLTELLNVRQFILRGSKERLQLGLQSQMDGQHCSSFRRAYLRSSEDFQCGEPRQPTRKFARPLDWPEVERAPSIHDELEPLKRPRASLQCPANLLLLLER